MLEIQSVTFVEKIDTNNLASNLLACKEMFFGKQRSEIFDKVL
jgi:hypothetical protein